MFLSYIPIIFLECLPVSPKKNTKKINCFVHSVSPIKTGGDKKYRYFDCNLQTKDKVVRAEHNDKFDLYQKTKSPIKITKLNVKRSVIFNIYVEASK